MSKTASVATRKMVEFLTDSHAGLEQAVVAMAQESGLELAPIPRGHVLDQNVSFELNERAQAVKYPAVYVYSDRVRNLQIEKFRTFSGRVRTVVEIRFSQDRIEGVEERLRLYVDAVTQVLDANRGSWGEGAFFTGGYEVRVDPVRHGGKNYLQVAKVEIEVDVSI